MLYKSLKTTHSDLVFNIGFMITSDREYEIWSRNEAIFEIK